MPSARASQTSSRNSSREWCCTASFMRSRNSSSVSGLRAMPTTAKRSGSSRRKASEYSAGNSLRFVRSPDAPKMTRMQGSGIRRSCSPSSSGFSWVVATLARVFAGLGALERADRVAAELLPQRGGDARGELDLVTRGEAREERSRDHRRGHVLVDRLGDRPATRAGILHVRRDVLELRAVLLERRVQKLQQPRADDRAVAPDAGDLLRVELELGVLHDLEALGVRLHQAVLDAVVHHLHEVPCARRADVRVALLRRERREDRLESLHRLVVAADHQAEADLEAPDAAGHAGVDVVDPALLRLRVAALRVAEVRVAAVDDRVVLVGDAEQLVERVLGDLAGGDHHPECARRLELALQLLERACRALDDVRVIGLDVVPAFAQALRHAVSHPAEPDHPQLCHRQILTLTILRPRSRSERKSPSACARIRRPKPKSWPGMGISSPVSSTTWTKRPVGGPPLCSWPVECRYRGPRPCVTTQPVSRARAMRDSSSRSRIGSINA